MQTLGAQRKGSIPTYVIICLLITASSSLFNPVLSFYLNTELGFSPLHISLFFVLLPIATILIVQTVARFSDMGLQRPSIICIASLFGVAASLLLYSRPSYLVLCTIGLVCLGSYPVSFPQIFASAREYAIKNIKRGSLMFTTFLRSLASLSWVIGPPISYGIALGGSFDLLFMVTMGMFSLCCLASFLFLPNVLDKSVADKSRHIAWWKNSSVMMLFVGIACMFTAFSSYMTTMPLYVTQELKLPENTPGFMLSLAAGLEIPLMFLAARLSKAIGLKVVVIAGACSLLVFLVLLHFAHTQAHMLWIQFFSALYIAFVASMGMVFFQELLPTIPGQATSLYINASTSGQIAGGALISLASSGSYLIIYEVGCGIAALGIILLCLVKKPPRLS
ncbi:MAG TPA: MFS transporter [Candidatus Anaerobiospirillum stercoravium]|nr:MFS transporter [Candidatus Anaerobiospirillum stercoravium]